MSTSVKKNDFFNYIIIKRENRASSNHSHRPTLTIPRVTDAANRLPQEVRTKKKKKIDRNGNIDKNDNPRITSVTSAAHAREKKKQYDLYNYKKYIFIHTI